MYDASAGLHGK